MTDDKRMRQASLDEELERVLRLAKLIDPEIGTIQVCLLAPVGARSHEPTSPFTAPTDRDVWRVVLGPWGNILCDGVGATMSEALRHARDTVLHRLRGKYDAAMVEAIRLSEAVTEITGKSLQEEDRRG